MHIVAISDLHGFLPKTPKCDVLVVCGDICPLEDHSRKYQLRWLRLSFEAWLRAQPAKWIIVIAGNHDIVTEHALAVMPSMPCHYLLNSGVEIDGVKFWGSPMIPPIGSGWAWMAPENHLADLWMKIPEDTDVLVTHGPAYGARDRTYFGEMVGSESLRYRIKEVQPLLHLCGHVHPSYGTDAIYHEGGRTVVGNASIVDGLYHWVNDPLQFRLSKEANFVQQLQ